MDAAGRVVWLNTHARQLLGTRLGRPVPGELATGLEVFARDGRRYTRDELPVMRSLTRGETVVDEEYFHRLDDAGRLSIRYSSWALHDADGRVSGAVVIMIDVTDHVSGYYERLIDNIEDAVIAVDPQMRITLWSKSAERLYGWSADEVRAHPVAEFAEPVMSLAERTAFDGELAAHGRVRTTFHAARKDGTGVEVERIMVAVPAADGALAGYLGIYRDVAQRKPAEAAPHALADSPRHIADDRKAERDRAQRARQQALVAELGLRALASEDLQSLMDDATSLVASAVDVELVAIAEVLPGAERLLLRAGVGWREGAVGSASGGSGLESLVGYTVMAAEPVVSEDLVTDNRFRRSTLLIDHEAVSAAGVVIPGRDDPFGVLGVFSRTRRTFSADDVNFLQVVANMVSTAVERVGAERHVREAREDERLRIAADLRDEVLPGLTEAVADAQRRGPRLPGEDRWVEALKRAGEQVRGAIYELRLDEQRDRPLSGALRDLVDVHRAMARDCEITANIGDAVLSRSLGRRGTEVLRIVGEALTNARRHAHARHVEVRATGSAVALTVAVTDDGRGLDPAHRAAGPLELGIRGMRRRAEMIGARLDVRSDPSGTTVEVEVEVDLIEDGPEAVRPANVLLVEDHAAVREAIARALDDEAGIHVVAQAASLAEARTMLEGIDVAVVDLGLPDGNGSDLIEDLRRVSPRAQAVILSASTDRADIAAAIARGAAGVIDKAAHLGDLVAALRRVRAGEMLLPVEEVVELLRFAGTQRERQYSDRQLIASLTTRELEVLQALADGLSTEHIAGRLHISVRTARNHVANILAKLGVHSQLQALLFALRYDVVKLPDGDR